MDTHQPTENSDPATGTVKWHPKLTPYRLLVLGTTIGIGTAKAVLSQKGKGLASTTLEWISGVLIFLVLHSMSTFDESPKDPPPLLSWLFRVDCMDYVWYLLSYLYIGRPPYSSEPQPTLGGTDTYHADGSSNLTPVTLFRLTVCFTTMCFGLTKATLAYFGYSTAATWIDWILGVIATVAFYIVGLYESNPVGTWRRLFSIDYSTDVKNGVAKLAVSTVFLTFVGSSIWTTFAVINDTDEKFSKFLAIDQPTALVALRGWLFRACLILLVIACYFFSMGHALRPIAVLTGEPEAISQDAIESWIWKHTPWRDRISQYKPQRISTRVAAHLILHLTLISGCGVYVVFWIVTIACNIEGISWLFSHQFTTIERIKHMLAITLLSLFELFGATVCMFLIGIIVHYSFLPPIFRYWNGDSDWIASMNFT